MSRPALSSRGFARTAALAAVAALAAFAAACSGTESKPPAPQLPPLVLQPCLPQLEAMVKAALPPTPAQQHELKDLAEIALQLVSADARTTARAERALLEHPFAWSALEPALLDERLEVRQRAAWLCGQSGQSVLQVALLLRLKYELDPIGVLWVADALQRLGNDAGLPYLDGAMGVAATAQQAGELAIAVCRDRGIALGEQPTYVELQGKLRELHGRWLAQGTSARAGVAAPDPALLAARYARHLATTQGTQLRPVDDARFVLTRSGVLALPILERTLQAEEPYLRTMALQVLNELGRVAHPLGPAMLPLLSDPLTANYAIRALGAAGCTEAIPFLRQDLTANDVELRWESVQALGLLGDTTSAVELRRLLGDTNEALDVRVGAAFGLLCLGQDAAAEAFLAEREAKGDYHAQTLARLRERLQNRRG